MVGPPVGHFKDIPPAAHRVGFYRNGVNKVVAKSVVSEHLAKETTGGAIGRSDEGPAPSVVGVVWVDAVTGRERRVLAIVRWWPWLGVTDLALFVVSCIFGGKWCRGFGGGVGVTYW